jgi:hypothetical protein
LQVGGGDEVASGVRGGRERGLCINWRNDHQQLPLGLLKLLLPSIASSGGGNRC